MKKSRFSDSQVMAVQVITVQAAQNIDECMQIMTKKHVRHLPITEGQRVIGVIFIGDVVREMMAHQKTIIEQLHSCIAG